MASFGAGLFEELTGQFNAASERVNGWVSGNARNIGSAVSFGQGIAEGIARHPTVAGFAGRIRSSSPQSFMLPGAILFGGYMDYQRYRGEGSGTLGALMKAGASTAAWMYAPAWMMAGVMGREVVKGAADAMYTASVRYMEEAKNPFENAAELTAFGMQSQRAALARVNALTSATAGDQVLGNEAAILHQYYRGFYA